MTSKNLLLYNTLLFFFLQIIVSSSIQINSQTKYKTFTTCEQIEVSSDSFKNDELIDVKYTSYGDNISPQLNWSEIPDNTKSFALVVEDPDAQKIAGKTYIHWIIKNIPADVTSFDEGDFEGDQIENMAGQEDYFGPKPPQGTGVHHYYFKIYALSVEEIDAENYNDFVSQVQKYKIGSGQIVALYEKK